MKAAMRPLIALCLFTLPTFAAKEESVAQRLNEATDIFTEIMNAPDKSIPADLLNKAHCIVLVPALKSAALLSERSTAKVSCFAVNRVVSGGRRQPRSGSKAEVSDFR